MTEIALALAAIWAVCGARAYGRKLYAFQTEFPRNRSNRDVSTSLRTGLAGPFGLIAARIAIRDTSMPLGFQWLPKPPVKWEWPR